MTRFVPRSVVTTERVIRRRCALPSFRLTEELRRSEVDLCPIAPRVIETLPRIARE